MKLVEFVPPKPHSLRKLCHQMGIGNVIVKVSRGLRGLAAVDRHAAQDFAI